MKHISRVLSLMICLQLSISCNNNNISLSKSLPTPSVSNKIKISGTIAQVFHTMSNLVFPQALADGGTLKVYNVDDPNDPIEVYSTNLPSDSYSIEIEKTLIEDHLIQLSFTSNDDSSLDRIQLVQVSKDETQIDGSLDSDKELNARIVLAQLKYELLNEQIQPEDIKLRFGTIKDISLVDQTDIVPISTIRNLLNDQTTSTNALNIIINHRRIIEYRKLLDEGELEKSVADFSANDYTCPAFGRCMDPKYRMENDLQSLADSLLLVEIDGDSLISQDSGALQEQQSSKSLGSIEEM